MFSVLYIHSCACVILIEENKFLSIRFFISIALTGTFSKFNTVMELIWYTETDIKKLGIRNSSHRARIVSSLVALREKQQNSEYMICNFNYIFRRIWQNWNRGY